VDVTDVLRDRMQPATGLQWMVLASLGLHGVLVTAMVLAPGSWMRGAPAAPRTTMTISLSGGGDGPRNGGMTTVGGRPVQEQRPPEEAPKREAIVQPAARTPVMTLPRRDVKATKAATSTVKQAPDEARGRTPTKGAETSPGNSLAITGARGLGFGLASGGGPGSGSSLDVENFCCPEYIALMVDRMRANWNQNQDGTGHVLVHFTIYRDGSVRNVSLEKSSGSASLDVAAQRAVLITTTLPPLPDAFPNPTLGVRLDFDYK
jgi:TonB family protein